MCPRNHQLLLTGMLRNPLIHELRLFLFFFFCEVCLYLIIKLQSIYTNIRVSKHLHPHHHHHPQSWTFSGFFSQSFIIIQKKKKAKYFTLTLKKAGGGRRGELGRETQIHTFSA